MTFLIILDGADESTGQERTADMPVLRAVAAAGVSGKAAFYVPGRSADSLSCICTMLGVPAREIPQSRAPLEALGASVPVGAEDLVFRCNVVSVRDGRLASFNGGALSKREMERFARLASGAAQGGGERDVRLCHLSDYRNLIVLRDAQTRTADSGARFDPPPPHESVGLPVARLLRGIERAGPLGDFIKRSALFKEGYLLYPWGAGRAVRLPSFESLAGKRAGCVCRAEIVAGIVRAMGMELYVPPGATADCDTDLHEKAKAARRLSERCDTVIVHVNGADELAHRKDYQNKVRFLEKVDRALIGGIAGALTHDARFVITADHVTSSVTGRHENLPVRFYCADYHAKTKTFALPAFDSEISGNDLFFQLVNT